MIGEHILSHEPMSVSSPRSVTLKLDIEVRVLRERQLEHGWVGCVIQHMSGNVSPIQGLPHLVCRLRVPILDKRLEACCLLKSC